MAVLNISDSDFDEKVLNDKNIVLCDFWAEWCGPCKQISPILEELSEELQENKITIAKVNIDEGIRKTIVSYINEREKLIKN